MIKNIKICLIVFGIVMIFCRKGDDTMVKRKNNPYTYTVKKDNRPIPVMPKEQYQEALSTVEKTLLKNQ